MALKKKTVAQLKKKLDKVFSLYVRRKYADPSGMVRCYTCSKAMHWKQAHAGHYVSRRHHSLRWDERNVRVQGACCNTFRAGAPDVFALNLIKEYGQGILEELNREKRQIKKWTKGELEALIEKYETN